MLNDDLPMASIEVKLFNTPKSFKNDDIAIRFPSKLNIQSRLNVRGQARYTRDNFIESTVPFDGPSQDAVDAEISESWDVAFQQMNHEDLESNDGLPSTLSALLSGDMIDDSDKDEVVVKTPKSKGKRKANAETPSPNRVVDENWSPPGPDPLLEIPGERVLAREKRNKTEFWPARILSYIPPAKSTEQPKYHVQYLDNSEYELVSKAHVI